MCFANPFGIVGIIIILIIRFSWSGLIIPGVILLVLPLQILIGKFNGKMIQRINSNKDKRIKTCT